MNKSGIDFMKIDALQLPGGTALSLDNASALPGFDEDLSFGADALCDPCAGCILRASGTLLNG